MVVSLRGSVLQDFREKPEVAPCTGVWALGSAEGVDFR